MEMIRRFVYGIFFAVIMFVQTEVAVAQDNVIDRVEWVVGDKAILRSDIEETIRYWLSNGRQFDGDPYCIVGEDLAIQQLFIHQAAIDSVEVDEAGIMRQVEAQMDYVIRQIGSKEKLEEYFDKTSSEIREMYREQLYNMEMMEAMKRKLVGEIKVSPLMVRRFCDSLPKDSFPYVQEQVEVQVITLEPEIDIEEIERVKGELRDYTERVTNGETSFSTLALLYSQDPGSARNGGELDFKGRGELQPEFAAVAFNLTDPNKVSKIVETEYGFHIIQLVEKRGDRVKVRHILRKPEYSSDNIKKMLLRLDSISTDIKDKKFTFEEGAEVISHDKDTRNNYGIMYNKNKASSYFTLEELPADVARVVDGLAVGDISQPFAWQLDNGKTVCAIAKLKSRTDAHIATFEDDYETMRTMYQMKLSEERVQAWIKQKQKSTYVRINSDNRNCEFKYPDWQFYEEK
ncbi:MAG: peptidylprolyl isomerase [Bacteroidaceae bacterium]|nr:peptidylprolyl isomerase [Bacteroidaceae bacterium]